MSIRTRLAYGYTWSYLPVPTRVAISAARKIRSAIRREPSPSMASHQFSFIRLRLLLTTTSTHHLLDGCLAAFMPISRKHRPLCLLILVAFYFWSPILLIEIYSYQTSGGGKNRSPRSVERKRRRIGHWHGGCRPCSRFRFPTGGDYTPVVQVYTFSQSKQSALKQQWHPIAGTE